MFGKNKKRKTWRKILGIFRLLRKRGKKDGPKVRNERKTGNFWYDRFGFGGDGHKRRGDSDWDDPWRKV